MSKVSKDPCKPYACAIQTCLKNNNYQEHKCSEALELMRLCCVKWHTQSLCCSGIDLEKSYLQKLKTGNSPELASSEK